MSTLKPGRVFLLGLNPGGSPQRLDLPTVGGSLDRLPAGEAKVYLDTCWNGYALGEAPLQMRVTQLLRQLGEDPASVAASNLILVRSRDASSSRFDTCADLCWRVHEKILEIIRPRLLLVLGNSGGSPYPYPARHFQATEHTVDPSGYGTWTCRSFVVSGRFRVVGLRHLGLPRGPRWRYRLMSPSVRARGVIRGRRLLVSRTRNRKPGRLSAAR